MAGVDVNQDKLEELETQLVDGPQGDLDLREMDGKKDRVSTRATRRQSTKKPQEEMSNEELINLINDNDDQINNLIKSATMDQQKMKTLQKKNTAAVNNYNQAVTDKDNALADNAKLYDKVKQLEQAVNQAQSGKDQAIQNMNNAEKQSKLMQDLMEEAETESKDKDDKILILEGKLKEQNEESSDLVNSVLNGSQKVASINKKKVLIFADNSRKGLIRKLERSADEEWTSSTDVFTTDKLLDKTKDKDYVNRLTKYNSIVLALGTDEIKDGLITGYEAFDKLAKIAHQITKVVKVHVTICQPPPSRVKTGEFAVMNSRFRSAVNDDKVVFLLTEDAFKYTLKSMSVLENSCTLTETGIEIYTKSLCDQLLVPDKSWADTVASEDSVSNSSEEESDYEVDDSSPSVTVEVPEDLMKHVIGKGGRIVKQIQDKTHTIITRNA